MAKTPFVLHVRMLEMTFEEPLKRNSCSWSRNCSWNVHVDDVIGKAGRALHFIQRNLKCSHPKLKETAYLTCVHQF